MKTLFTSLLLVLSFFFMYAQAPIGFNYQGLSRDNKGKELSNAHISLRLSIVKDSASGTSVYSETHNITTNGFGLFSIRVGNGKIMSGNFNKINWANGLYFQKVEMDPIGGTAFAFLGTSQLISVPYSIMANVSLKALNDLDTSATNELQILKFSNDTLYLDRGGYIYLGNYDDKNAIQQIKTKLYNDSNYFEIMANDERAQRQINDYKLNLKSISDSSYLHGLINTNTTNLAIESNARIMGDQNQKTKQIADSSYLRIMINSTNTNLSTETINRMAADQNQKTKHVADSSYLKGLITNEISNRTNNNNTLQTNINNLKAKEASDSSMFAGALTTTITNLTTETNSRISGDQTLKTKIVADSTYLKGQINSTNTNLATTNTNLATTNTNLVTETTNRTNADNSLQSNISTETNTRISSDNTLRSKVVSDSTYLKGQIINTNTNLATETNNRINGDNGIRTKMTNDSSAIRSFVNTTNTNLATTNTNLATETVNRIAGDNSIRTKMTSDSSSIRTLINTTNNNLTNETNARISGDQSLKTKVGADSSYLKGQINTKQDKLTAGSGITINTSNKISALDTSSINELQTIQFNNDSLSISKGNKIYIQTRYYNDYSIYEEQYPSGQSGPSYLTTIFWQTRNINTTVDSSGQTILRSGNIISLTPGKYHIIASAPGFSVRYHRIRFRNITDNVVVLNGTSEFCNSFSYTQTRSLIDGIITINSNKYFKIEHYCTGTDNSGMGLPVGTGSSEIYTKIYIEKIK